MSHGRCHPQPQRAPAVSRRCSGAAHSPLTRSHPFRIGPPTLDDGATWHARGVDHERAGDLDDAVKCYRLALMAGRPDRQVVFDLAYALASLGKRSAAIERYHQVLEMDPCRDDAWTNLGILLMEESEVDAGVEAFRKAVQLNPNDAAARFNLADALHDIRPSQAVDHWRAFLRLGNSSHEHVAHARQRLIKGGVLSENPSSLRR